MIDKLVQNLVKSQLGRLLSGALLGVDPETAPDGTEVRAKSGWDFAAYGRDIDVHVVFVIRDRKKKAR